MGHHPPYASRLHRTQLGGISRVSFREIAFSLTRFGAQTTIFGHKLKAPMVLAPIGLQGVLHPDGEIGTARAAKETKIPMVLSTAATRSMEEVAGVLENSHRWYQLYW